MDQQRTQWVPVFLVTSGVAITCACAVAARDALGAWQFGIYVGAGLALAAAVFFRRKVSTEQVEMEKLRAEIVSTEKQLKQDFQEFQTAQQKWGDQVEQQSHTIDQREEDLANKLVAFHEWTEFPQPIDLSSPAVSDAELTELAEKDRQMIALLEEESKQFFEAIRANEFSADGKFQPKLLADHLFDLVNRVARIYEPEMDQAYLETSIAQIMQAASRACLHFLVVLDRLPLNVKEYNINTMYGYVQTAVKAYGVYKFASPYLPYLKSAYYLGRFAMGASPVTMGAWWFAGALGQKGAQALATKVVNQHALSFLHDIVRVVGFEVAGIYGGGFRHRDANWIYATELTELISQLPASHQSLAHAMKEIGALELRSEYDRVYLYRLLSECQTANPAQFRPLVCLTGAERQAIAHRLEQFFDTFVSYDDAQIQTWQSAIEQRLNVKLRLGTQSTDLSADEQQASAVRSLASFLIAVKKIDPAQLTNALDATSIVKSLDEKQRDKQIDSLSSELPTFFEQPELDLTSELTDQYLSDLMNLAVNQPPFDQTDDAVLECAAYLRKDLNEIATELNNAFVERVRKQFPDNCVPKNLPPNVARAILNLIDVEDDPRYIYDHASVDSKDGSAAPLWLIGTSDRMILLQVDVTPVVLWRADKDVEFEDERNLLSSQCRIRGGRWLDEGDSTPVEVRVAGPMLGSYENYFAPLKKFSSEP